MTHIHQLLAVTDWDAAADRQSAARHVRPRREFDFLVDVCGDLRRPRLEDGRQLEFRWIGPGDVHLLSENRGVDRGLVRWIIDCAFELD